MQKSFSKEVRLCFFFFRKMKLSLTGNIAYQQNIMSLRGEYDMIIQEVHLLTFNKKCLTKRPAFDTLKIEYF